MRYPGRLVLLAVGTYAASYPFESHAMSFPPCSKERVELKASTPIRPITAVSMISADLAAVAIILEQGTPATSESQFKGILGGSVILVNYFLGFFSGGCYGESGLTEAPPLSDDERANMRRSWITQTYINGGFNLAASTAMLFLAEHPANRAVAAAAVAAPILTAILVRDRFRQGPARESLSSLRPDLAVSLAVTPEGAQPAFGLAFHF